MGQPPAHQWTRWPERGSQVLLENRQGASLSGMAFYYLGAIADGMAGGENVTLQIYANDGPPTNGSNGTPLLSPGTLLWTSAPIPVAQGDVAQFVEIPSVQVPETFTWTFKFQGGNLANGPFDPALNVNLAGGRFLGQPVNGAVPDGTLGVLWRRVFAPNPSHWAGQEQPAGWPSQAYNFGATFWSGDMALVRNGYDNRTNAQPVQFYLGLPSDGYNEVGNNVAAETTNRLAQRIESLIYVQTQNEAGSPTARIRLYDVERGGQYGGGAGAPDGPPLWESPPFALPLGKGNAQTGEAEALELSAVVPGGLVLPADGRFAWSVVIDGMQLDGQAGPAARFRSDTRGMTDPGVAPFGFFQRRPSNRWEGPFIFQNNPPNNGMPWQYSTLFDARLTTVPFERLSPSSFTIGFGRLKSGTVQSLGGDDGEVLSVCKFIVPNQSVPPVSVEVYATLATGVPTSVRADVKARMDAAGLFRLTVELRDFTKTGEAGWGDPVVSTIGTSFISKSVTGTAPFDRYVSNDRRVAMRYSVRPAGPSAANAWCVDADFVRFIVGL